MRKEDFDNEEDKEYYLEYIKYLEFEMKVADIIENCKPEELEDNINKIGFIKVFEVEGTAWFLSENISFIIVVAEDVGWHLYERTVSTIYGKK